jgi:hypothetical protein
MKTIIASCQDIRHLNQAQAAEVTAAPTGLFSLEWNTICRLILEEWMPSKLVYFLKDS